MKNPGQLSRITALVFIVIVCGTAPVSAQNPHAVPAHKSTTLETATDAYIYGYPLVLEEFTQQTMLKYRQLEAINRFTPDTLVANSW